MQGMALAERTSIRALARGLAVFLTFALGAAALAAPAPWYQWRSKLTGDVTCAQVMRGEWERIAGPYKDARCRVSGVPGD
jgi:hypothetical protein